MKKPRHRPTATPAPRHPSSSSFTLHPLSLACLVALAGPALALPTGGTVVGGQATIAKPTASLQVVTQNTPKAVIDWTSFSIASGETVRFDQPSSSAVLLNRVTGYDPSAIFGQMQSNGRVFLLNPYGVVFGASARVDVGGLVASSLSLSSADFMAGRFSLSSSGDTSAPSQRGEVRNEGVISAPGGVVVLAGPVVSNTGTIAAAGGRVGLAAAQEALVDVEGDGLIFFRTTGTEAGNRLAQLGRIQADGGSVELRAAARGAFADTVLNMGGAVQARSLGVKQGRVVIDGGDAGITRVAGTVDASGAAGGEHGGQVSVRGQKVLLDLAAVLNASGDAGGGKVTVGGDWQGQGASADLGANAQMTHVASGARIDVGATGRGDGGTAVVWSDGSTHFSGTVQARGGNDGGNGGQVEVSGKQQLAFAGSVVTLAPRGNAGALLLDPTDITIAAGGTNQTTTSTPPAPFTIEGNQGASNLPVGTLTSLLNTNGSVTVDATAGTGGTGSISVETPIGWNSANSLTLKADTTIESTAAGSITNTGTGGLSLFTDGAITLRAPVSLAGGSFTVGGTAGVGDLAASFTTTSTISTSAAVAGGNAGVISIQTVGPIGIQGAITAVGGTGSDGALSGTPGGNGGIGGNVSISTTAGSVATLGIDTRGGAGGTGQDGTDSGSSHGGSGGTGGNAGTIQLTSDGTGNDTTVGGALVARGGLGGDGGDGSGGNADGGAGGQGGNGANVGVVSGGARVLLGTAGTVATGGGAGGTPGAAGTSGNAGAAPGPSTRGNISISAGTDFTVTSTLDTTGGTGTGTVSLTVGAAGAGGTLDLGTPGLISAGTLSLAGGTGTDKIVATLSGDFVRTSGTPATLLVNGQSAGITSIEHAEVTGSAGNNTIDVAGFGGNATIHLSGGTDTVNGTGANNRTTLIGQDVASTFVVDNPNAGSVTSAGATTTFGGVGNLTGGSQNDAFDFTAATSSLTGSINGGGNAGGAGNTLNLAGLGAGATLTIDQQAATATGIGGTFGNIGSVTGNGANTTLVGTTAGQAYTITGSNGGTAGTLAFSGVANITAGNGADSFAFTASSSQLTGTLAAGGGTNTLDLAGLGAAKTVSIDQEAGTITDTAGPTSIVGAYSGISSVNGNGANTTIAGVAAGQTFTVSGSDQGAAGTLDFTHVGSLRGGGGTNTFVVGAGGSLGGSITGGAGADTLNLSAVSGAVAVNQQTGTASRIGGTYAGIETLVGNGSNTTLTGSNAGQTFAVTAPGQGTAGALAFSGVTGLVGGTGADTFTFSGTGALLGNLSDNGGTTTLNGAISTGGSQNYAGAVTLASDVALTSSGDQAVSIGGAVDGAHALTITSAGQKTLGGAVGSGTAPTSLSIAGGGTTSITGGAVTTSGAQSYDSAVVATTLALTTTGAAGDITAANVGNDFGTVTLQTVNGANLTLVDANSLVLGNVSLGTGTHAITAGPTAPGTGATLTRGGTFSAGSAPTLTVGGTGVDATVREYFMTGSASSIAIQKGGGATHNLTATGASVLPTLTVSGNLGISGSAAITQTGAITVAGTSIVDAGANAVTLTNASNDFQGALGLTGTTVQVTDANALALGSVSAGSLVAHATGPVTQNAAVAVTGTTNIDAGTGDITLANAGNDFGGAVTLAGGAIALSDANALAVAGLTGAANGSVDLRALGGTLTLPTQAINTGAGTLTLVGTGGISQGAGSTLVSSGLTTVDAGTQALVLTQANVLSGLVDLTGGATQLTNTVDTTVVLHTTGTTTLSAAAGRALNVSGTTTGALSLTGASATVDHTGALNLGTGNLSGNLAVTTNGAAVSQSAALFVGGTTNVNAGAGNITLTNAGNDFGGTITIVGAAVSLADANDLSVSGSATGPLSLAGTNVTVSHTGALTLGASTIGGTFGITTNGAPVTQSGALNVAGTTSVNAGAGNVTLAHAANDFVGNVTVSGGAISVTDANNLTVSATPGANRSLSLIAGGALNLLGGGTIDTGSADLNLSSGTGLSTTGALRGTNVSLAGGSGGITLNNDVIAAGTLSLTANNAAITQASGTVGAGGATSVNAGAGTGAITLNGSGNDFQGAVGLTGGTVQIRDANALTLGGSGVGSLAVVANGNVAQTAALAVAGTTGVAAGSGDVTLTHPANDFIGQVTVSGGAISVVDANNLNVVATPGANRSLSLVAGGTLTIPGGNIDTGTADLTLSSGAGLSTTGALRGANVSLGGGTGAIALNNDITASGALTLTTTNATITQSAGNIGVGAATHVNSGTGDVTLLSLGNDFQGSVDLVGGITQVRDANTLTLGSVAVNWLGVASTGALDLGSGSIAGLFVALSGGGAVSQSGALTVGGSASIDAGGGNVTLTSAGNDFGTLAVAGGAIALRNLNALTLGTVTGSSLAVDTSAGNGAVTQSGALSIAGSTAVNAGSGNVTLTNAGNNFGSFGATAGAISVVDAAGGIELGAINATSLTLNTAAGNGAVTQTAAAQVGGATAITSGSGDLTLTQAGNDFGTVALAGAAISVVDANDLTVTSLASGANRAVSLVAGHNLVLPASSVNTGTADLTLGSTTGVLDVNGALAGRAISLTGGSGITLHAGVTSSADQTYAGALTLANDAALSAGAGRIALQSAVDGGGHNLALTSSHAATDAIRTGAAVTNVGTFSATGNTTLGGNVTSSGNQTYTASLALAADAALNAGSGRVALQGAVDGGGHNLALTSSHAATDAIRTGASISNVGTFSATGNTTLGGSITSSGDQTYAAPLALAADAALNAGSGRVALQGAVDGGGHDLALTSNHAAADAIRTGATVADVGSFSATGNTTLGGNVSSSGNQTYTAALALAADAALNAGAGLVALQGAVDGGGHNLALTSSNAATDAIRTGAAVANIGSFSATGNTTLGGNVTASGHQTYTGPVQLTVATMLTGVDLTLLGTVDGAQALTLAGSGTTTFAAAVGGSTALASITDGGGGTTRIGSAIATTGTQQWGDALALTGATTLSGSTLTFGSTIDGAQALTVVGSASTAVFNGAVGNTAALTSLNVTGPTQLNGGSVTTTGSQAYAGTVTLGADTVLAGNGITIAGALDGAHALTVHNAGTTTFGGAVGLTSALTSLATQDNGAVALAGAGITTNGAQTYSGSVQLAGSATFSGSTLSFGAGASGAQDLTLRTDTLNLTGNLVGTGTLTIAPRSTDRTIGVAGGAGDLKIPQTLLSGAGGFTQHVIGRTDGTGDVEVGALQLASETTLEAGTGNLTLNGTVDGPFSLTLNSGGTTSILGSIGTGSALRSLTTDNHAGVADWNGSSGEHTRVDAAGGARIVTTGEQTFNDPLVVAGGVRFDGGTITATQASNEFRGTVDASATQLNLVSNTTLVLGNITLAGGGRIETAQTLELAGALRLNGGTLSLVANGQPTARDDFADPDLAGQQGRLSNGAKEASATIFQGEDGTVATAAGSLLVLRSPHGGSILLDNEPDPQHLARQNDLLGGISAVSGALGSNTTTDTLGFVRISSTEIHAAGAPPADGSQSPLEAGIEGDVLKLSADKITTGLAGQLHARLPYSNVLGSRDSIPGLTLIMSPTALTIGGGFGLSTPDGYIQVHVGNELGGFVTVRPRGATGENAFILLAGPEPRPFYDLNGKADEVRIFYNGDAPRTPQETGALSALMAIVEDARQTRFEEAVRTENVKSRLRSGVIAEVGSGRPATVGRESIRLPSSCNPKDTTLQCQ